MLVLVYHSLMEISIGKMKISFTIHELWGIIASKQEKEAKISLRKGLLITPRHVLR